MPQLPLPADEERRRWDAYLLNGKSATKAAKAAGMRRSTYGSWLSRFLNDLETAGLKPEDADKWFSRQPDSPIVPARAIVSAAEPAPESEPTDPIDLARAKAAATRMRQERDAAVRAAIEAQDIRREVFGLVEAPLEPVSFQPAVGNEPKAETIVCFLSDLHWGETIDYAAMDGLNSYDLQIARNRLRKYFQSVLELATKHWCGPPPARLILILGGDMISGEIHMELAKTNQAMAIPAVRDLVGHMSAGIRLLLENIQCPIDIISVPGNHGRSTLKPESKLAVATSYDVLVSDFLEMQFKSESRITFYTPWSGDALFSIYGFRVLATHGDKIGSRGGQGFVGPAATAARGFKKVVQDYAARGVHLDYILIGHFHTPLRLEEGFVNGTLAGPNEYSRDGRYRPRPAEQLFLAFHPKRGVSQIRLINPGSAEEGSLYEAPPVADIRPRFRMQARTQRV